MVITGTHIIPGDHVCVFRRRNRRRAGSRCLMQTPVGIQTAVPPRVGGLFCSFGASKSYRDLDVAPLVACTQSSSAAQLRPGLVQILSRSGTVDTIVSVRLAAPDTLRIPVSI